MRPTARFRIGVSLLALAAAAVSSATIQYTVKIAPDNKSFVVTIDAPVPKNAKDFAVQSPRWMPGSYDYGDFGKEITNVAMKDQKGNAVTFDHPDFSTWHVANPPAGTIEISYDAPGEISNDVMHLSGAPTYMYVVGRTQEPCTLTVDVPADWPIDIGLNTANGKTNVFTAPNYDVLADNPITAGKFYADSYTVNGKMHYIALRGAPEDMAAIDKKKLHKVTQFVSSMESSFWGGEPYDHYVWHFTCFPRADGGWGLEHLASTQIGLATGFGMNTDSVLAHELFHAWNVKRIRSKVLGPFDYQQVPKTGALWWLEGVTDYYADTLLRRYGWTDDPRYYFVIGRNVNAERGNDQRFQVSPYDSSYRVSEAEGGRGNSNGFGVSYYNTGWLVGLCLDMKIREVTHDQKSLDDVCHNLFAKYAYPRPGFAEDGIRTELVNIGGPTLGDMYDQIVMKPGELPVEDALTKVGLKLSQKDEQYAKLGFMTSFDRDAGGLDIHNPEDFTSLKDGDVITAINGTTLQGQGFTAILAAMGPLNSPEAGKAIHLTVTRKGETNPLQIDVTPVQATRKTWVVDEIPDAPLESIARRKAWLSPPAGWVPPQG